MFDDIFENYQLYKSNSLKLSNPAYKLMVNIIDKYGG